MDFIILLCMFLCLFYGWWYIYKYIHSNLFQETWEASKEKMCERVGVGREERSDRIIKSFGRRFHPEPLTVMEPAGFWSTGGQGRACSRKATGTPLTSGFEPTTLVFAGSLPQRVWSRDAWLSWNARFVWPFRFQNNKLLISRLNPPTPPYAFIVCSTS
jgi:hypothetical protein